MHLALHSARIILLLYGLGASCSFPQECEKGTSCSNIENDKTPHHTHRIVRRTPAAQIQTSWDRLSVSEQVEFYRSVSAGADIFQDFFTRRERVRDEGHGPNSVRNTYTWISGKMNEIFRSDVVNYPGYLEGYFSRPNVVNTINATEAVRNNAPERTRGNEHHLTSSRQMKAFVTPIEAYANQVGLTFREPKGTYLGNPEYIDTAHVLMQSWRILRPPGNSRDSKYPIWIEVDQVLDHERDLDTDGEIVESILKLWNQQHAPESISFSLHSANEDKILGFYALLGIPPRKEVMNMLATYGHELEYPTIQKVSIMKNIGLGGIIPRVRLYLSQTQYSPEDFKNMILRHTRTMLNRFYELQSRVDQNLIPEELRGMPSLPHLQNTPTPPNLPPLPQNQPQGNIRPSMPQQPVSSRRSSSELMPPPPIPEHRMQQPPPPTYGYTYGRNPPRPNPARRVAPTRPRSFPVPSSEFTMSFTDMFAPGAAPRHPQPDTSRDFQTSRHSGHSTPSRTQTSAPPKSEIPLREKYQKLQKSLGDPSAGFNLPDADMMKGVSHIGGWYQADNQKPVRTAKSTSSLKPPSQSKHVRFASDISTKDSSSQQPTSGQPTSRPSGGMSTSRSFDDLRTTGRISGDPALPRSPHTLSSKRSRDDLSPERSVDTLSTKRSRENLSARRSFGDIPESPLEKDLYSLPPGSGALQPHRPGNIGPIGRQSGDITTEGALSADLRSGYQPLQQAVPIMGRSFSERMAEIESFGRRMKDSHSKDTLPRANFPRPPPLTPAAASEVDSFSGRMDEHRHRTMPRSGISNAPDLPMSGAHPSGTLSSRPFTTTGNSASQAPSENLVNSRPRRRIPVQEYYIDPNDPEDPEVIEEAHRMAEEQRLPIAFPPRRGEQRSRFQPTRTPSASQTGSSTHRLSSESDKYSSPTQPSTTTRPSASS